VKGTQLRSGFVSILGRPNAGKSTLVNTLTGEKVAIVTSKPQTTRTRVHGVVEVEAREGRHDEAQIVFVDTPGVHKPGSQLDRQMMQVVYDALESRDLVLVMVDASRKLELPELEAAPAAVEGAENIAEAEPKRVNYANLESEDAFVFELIRKLDCPVFLLINKVDLVPREQLLPMIAMLSARYPFAEVLLLSARRRDGLDELVEKIVQRLPERERIFPKDQFTDQPERFLASELIRERILMETGEEVPYASAVVIEQWEEPQPQRAPRMLKGNVPAPQKPPLTKIAAAIYCEREGQKAILIGKGGAKLKAIGASARMEIERMLGTRVFLQLHIIVEPGWREKTGFLDTLDWRRQLDDLAKRRLSGE
jgi:GTP-binding protein Era